MKRVDPVTRFLAWCGALFIAAPILAIVIKVPWSHFFSALRSDSSLTAVWLTLWTSVVALGLCVLFGIPLAWWLSRSSGRITALIRPVVLAPIALPPTVAGLALLGLLDRHGLIGQWIYRSLHWQLPFTTYAVIVAGVFVGMPFLVLICESHFRQLPAEIEDAARIDKAKLSSISIDCHSTSPKRRDHGSCLGLGSSPGGVRRNHDVRGLTSGDYPDMDHADLPRAQRQSRYRLCAERVACGDRDGNHLHLA